MYGEILNVNFSNISDEIDILYVHIVMGNNGADTEYCNV